DLEAAYPFYAALLPELGFPHEWRGEGAFSFQTSGKLPRLSWFGVIENPHHLPNATRYAFAVESCEEVDPWPTLCDPLVASVLMDQKIWMNCMKNIVQKVLK